MFNVINLSTGDIFSVHDLIFVKLDDDGVWSRCSEDVAQCISVNGKRFSLANRPIVDDAPEVVAVVVNDAAFKISKLNFDALGKANELSQVKAAILDISDAVLDIYQNGV